MKYSLFKPLEIPHDSNILLEKAMNQNFSFSVSLDELKKDNWIIQKRDMTVFSIIGPMDNNLRHTTMIDYVKGLEIKNGTADYERAFLESLSTNIPSPILNIDLLGYLRYCPLSFTSSSNFVNFFKVSFDKFDTKASGLANSVTADLFLLSKCPLTENARLDLSEKAPMFMLNGGRYNEVLFPYPDSNVECFLVSILYMNIPDKPLQPFAIGYSNLKDFIGKESIQLSWTSFRPGLSLSEHFSQPRNLRIFLYFKCCVLSWPIENQTTKMTSYHFLYPTPLLTIHGICLSFLQKPQPYSVAISIHDGNDKNINAYVNPSSKVLDSCFRSGELNGLQNYFIPYPIHFLLNSSIRHPITLIIQILDTSKKNKILISLSHTVSNSFDNVQLKSDEISISFSYLFPSYVCPDPNIRDAMEKPGVPPRFDDSLFKHAWPSIVMSNILGRTINISFLVVLFSKIDINDFNIFIEQAFLCESSFANTLVSAMKDYLPNIESASDHMFSLLFKAILVFGEIPDQLDLLLNQISCNPKIRNCKRSCIIMLLRMWSYFINNNIENLLYSFIENLDIESKFIAYGVCFLDPTYIYHQRRYFETPESDNSSNLFRSYLSSIDEICCCEFNVLYDFLYESLDYLSMTLELYQLGNVFVPVTYNILNALLSTPNSVCFKSISSIILTIIGSMPGEKISEFFEFQPEVSVQSLLKCLQSLIPNSQIESYRRMIRFIYYNTSTNINKVKMCFEFLFFIVQSQSSLYVLDFLYKSLCSILERCKNDLFIENNDLLYFIISNCVDVSINGSESSRSYNSQFISWLFQYENIVLGSSNRCNISLQVFTSKNGFHPSIFSQINIELFDDVSLFHCPNSEDVYFLKIKFLDSFSREYIYHPTIYSNLLSKLVNLCLSNNDYPAAFSNQWYLCSFLSYYLKEDIGFTKNSEFSKEYSDPPFLSNLITIDTLFKAIENAINIAKHVSSNKLIHELYSIIINLFKKYPSKYQYGDMITQVSKLINQNCPLKFYRVFVSGLIADNLEGSDFIFCGDHSVFVQSIAKCFPDFKINSKLLPFFGSLPSQTIQVINLKHNVFTNELYYDFLMTDGGWEDVYSIRYVFVPKDLLPGRFSLTPTLSCTKEQMTKTQFYQFKHNKAASKLSISLNQIKSMLPHKKMDDSSFSTIAPLLDRISLKLSKIINSEKAYFSQLRNEHFPKLPQNLQQSSKSFIELLNDSLNTIRSLALSTHNFQAMERLKTIK